MAKSPGAVIQTATSTGKMVEITRIDPASAGKVNALFGLGTGILGGIISLISSTLISNFLSTMPGVDAHLVEQAQQYGFIGMILFIFLGVVIGFLVGVLTAANYNFVAKLGGGIKIRIE